MLIPRRPRRTPRPPRKQRPQRFQWRAGANTRAYLLEHPEREMAEARGGIVTCRACGIWRSYRTYVNTPGEALALAIFAAHSHNAESHPRRWIRSQHFQAPIPVEVRERAEA